MQLAIVRCPRFCNNYCCKKNDLYVHRTAPLSTPPFNPSLIDIGKGWLMKGWDLILYNIILADPGSPVPLLLILTNLSLFELLLLLRATI